MPRYVSAWLLATAATSALAATPEAASTEMSVRELMHLDAELARKQAQQRLKAVGHPLEPAAAVGNPSMHLAAVYGVGRQLLAEVVIGSRSHIYMRGQALPVGGKPGAGTYLLRGISGSCVHLERAGDSQTLCLRPSLWAARP